MCVRQQTNCRLDCGFTARIVTFLPNEKHGTNQIQKPVIERQSASRLLIFSFDAADPFTTFSSE
jgi:hypothetical protein